MPDLFCTSLCKLAQIYRRVRGHASEDMKMDSVMSSRTWGSYNVEEVVVASVTWSRNSALAQASVGLSILLGFSSQLCLDSRILSKLSFVRHHLVRPCTIYTSIPTPFQSCFPTLIPTFIPTQLVRTTAAWHKILWMVTSYPFWGSSGKNMPKAESTYRKSTPFDDLNQDDFVSSE